jgi:hypothetical protein
MLTAVPFFAHHGMPFIPTGYTYGGGRRGCSASALAAALHCGGGNRGPCCRLAATQGSSPPLRRGPRPPAAPAPPSKPTAPPPRPCPRRHHV